MLKKIPFLLLFLLVGCIAIAQTNTVSANRLNAIQNIVLRGNQIDSISKDTTLSANADNVLSTQRAIKTYIKYLKDTSLVKLLGAGDSLFYGSGDTLIQRTIRDSAGFHHYVGSDGAFVFYSTNSGGSGVTSVATAGTVNGLTLTGGPITGTGTITLGGTLSGINNSSLTNSTISGVSLGSNLFNLSPGYGITPSTAYNGSAAVTWNIDSTKFTTPLAVIDSIMTRGSRDTTIYFVPGSTTTTYTNTALIGKQLVMVSVSGNIIPTTAPSGFITYAFNASTGVITLTNGSFATDQSVAITYTTTSGTYLGPSNPVTNSDGTITVVGTVISVTNPNITYTSTSSSATTFSIPAGTITEFIALDPTSAETVQIGTTSSGSDILTSQSLSSSSHNFYAVPHRSVGTETFYVQGITSSTVITIYTRKQ